MTTNEFLKKTTEWMTKNHIYERFGITMPRPRAVCKDGFSVSIQAGAHLYCSPRINGAEKYDSVELGFPSEEDCLIMEHAEDETIPTETVYACVPVEVVDQLLEKHGGLIGHRGFYGDVVLFEEGA